MSHKYQPSWTYEGFTEFRRKNNELHREDGPAQYNIYGGKLYHLYDHNVNVDEIPSNLLKAWHHTTSNKERKMFFPKRLSLIPRHVMFALKTSSYLSFSLQQDIVFMFIHWKKLRKLKESTKTFV